MPARPRSSAFAGLLSKLTSLPAGEGSWREGAPRPCPVSGPDPALTLRGAGRAAPGCRPPRGGSAAPGGPAGLPPREPSWTSWEPRAAAEAARPLSGAPAACSLEVAAPPGSRPRPSPAHLLPRSCLGVGSLPRRRPARCPAGGEAAACALRLRRCSSCSVCPPLLPLLRRRPGRQQRQHLPQVPQRQQRHLQPRGSQRGGRREKPLVSSHSPLSAPFPEHVGTHPGTCSTWTRA